MDDDFTMISALVDSDDEVRMDADPFFTDLSAQHTGNLLRLLHSDTKVNVSVSSKHFNEEEINEVFLPSSNSNNVAVNIQRFSLNDMLSNSQKDFIQVFRIKHSLVDVITSFIHSASIHLSEFKMSPRQEMLAVLFYLGQEKIAVEDVCDRFKINFESFAQILNRITLAVCGLSHKEVCLPSERQKQNTKNYYAQNSGLQGIIGCIDTLPVKVLQSNNDKNSATSSHELIILQAVVNEDAKFMHIYVSSSAGTDEDILEMSKFYKEMVSVCSEKEYFLGGATYSCRKHLLTPYPDLDDLSADQIFYNLRVASCMQTTDAAFELLTKRFGKLVSLKLPNTAIARQIVTACCVLHNICDNADFENINEPPASADMVTQGYSRINSQTFQNASEEALALRDDVCKELVRNTPSVNLN